MYHYKLLCRSNGCALYYPQSLLKVCGRVVFFSHFSLDTLRIANVIPRVSDACCSEALQKLKHGNSVEMWCVCRLCNSLKILVSFLLFILRRRMACCVFILHDDFFN